MTVYVRHFLLLFGSMNLVASAVNNQTTRSGVKYADDCTLPENWRNKGLEITPTQYLSYLERRVKSGYAVSVRCSHPSKTFTSEIRKHSPGIGSTIDQYGYVKVYCDTKSFSPDIFTGPDGKEYSDFCKVGCTDLPLDATLYDITYPDGATNGATPVQYTESTSTVEDMTWEKDPATAIYISCKAKFTRPVNDEGVNTVRCQKSGGFVPSYTAVHSCKPGCEDITVNNLPGLIVTKDSKSVALKSGNPPFAFAEEDVEDMRVTFRCLSSYTMILKGEEVEQSIHWCSKERKGWVPIKELPLCEFTPSGPASVNSGVVTTSPATCIILFVVLAGILIEDSI